MTLATELKTPEQWCVDLGARIADPDGWRDGTRRWDEPITREEFDRRLLICTIDSRGYPTFADPATAPTPCPTCDGAGIVDTSPPGVEGRP